MKKCADCIHVNACGAWSSGSLINTRADSCMIYETIKDSNAYFLGYREAMKDRWIPVVERLPETLEPGWRSADVLATIQLKNGYKYIDVMEYYPPNMIDIWNGKSEGTWGNDEGCGYTVTAWMPLPETYDGGKNNAN